MDQDEAKTLLTYIAAIDHRNKYGNGRGRSHLRSNRQSILGTGKHKVEPIRL